MVTRPPTPLLSLSAFTPFFMMLSHRPTGGRLYLPPSLLRLGFRALMKMASLTPQTIIQTIWILLSGFQSNSTVCSGCSMWICFATSEVVELGVQCSLNLDFRDLSVSPTYFSRLTLFTLDLIHWSHHILFTDRVLGLDQQLSQHVHRLEVLVCWYAISLFSSSSSSRTTSLITSPG